MKNCNLEALYSLIYRLNLMIAKKQKNIDCRFFCPNLVKVSIQYTASCFVWEHPWCYRNLYVNSFFPRTARFWNFLPAECFLLTYDLNSVKHWGTKIWFFGVWCVYSLEVKCFRLSFLKKRDLQSFSRYCDKLQQWYK